MDLSIYHSFYPYIILSSISILYLSHTYLNDDNNTNTNIIGPQKENPPILKAECFNLLALLGKENAQYEETLSLFGDAIKIANTLNNQQKAAEYLINIGNIYLKLARFPEASEKFNEALRISKSGENVLSSSKTAEIFGALGLVAKKCSEYDKAIQVIQSIRQ